MDEDLGVKAETPPNSRWFDDTGDPAAADEDDARVVVIELAVNLLKILISRINCNIRLPGMTPKTKRVRWTPIPFVGTLYYRVITVAGTDDTEMKSAAIEGSVKIVDEDPVRYRIYRHSVQPADSRARSGSGQCVGQ